MKKLLSLIALATLIISPLFGEKQSIIADGDKYFSVSRGSEVNVGLQGGFDTGAITILYLVGTVDATGIPITGGYVAYVDSSDVAISYSAAGGLTLDAVGDTPVIKVTMTGTGTATVICEVTEKKK